MYINHKTTKDGTVLYGRDIDGALFITVQHKDGREHGYDQRPEMANFDHSLINEDHEMVFTQKAVLNTWKYNAFLERLGIDR